MNKSILLLDSTSKIYNKFKKQGFDIEEGTVGFCNGERCFPSQLYEKDIIIYDPYLKGDFTEFHEDYLIENETPLFDLDDLTTSIKQGGIFLCIIKPFANNVRILNDAYLWAKQMKYLDITLNFTKDNKINFDGSKRFGSITSVPLKKPVMTKFMFPNGIKIIGGHLFTNKKNETLGIWFKYGEGWIIYTPEYESSEDLIDNFLHRLAPELLDSEIGVNLIDEFISPIEIGVLEKIKQSEEDFKRLEQKIDGLKQDLSDADRQKVNKIKSDETAVLIINYYELATRQDDVALFFIYKIIDALEKKYGGEKEAKLKLDDLNKEWNLIGKYSNVSYGDARHAPKPGEKIKPWTQAEIKECFESAKKIIQKYIEKLF